MGQDHLSIHAVDDGRRITVRLGGALDVASADRFSEELRAYFVHGVPLHVHLGGVTFLDSLGISALVRVSDAARRELIPLTFSRGTGQAQAVLDMVRSQSFLTFSDADAA